MELFNSSVSAPTESERPANVKTIHITEGHYEVFILVNSLILCGFISSCGVIANVINLVVFYRQGLHITINISFFALAVSDLSCLLLQLWMFVISFSPYLDLPIVYVDLLHMTGGWPHETFSKLTCSITVYIMVERCLCVVFPMTIARIITRKRTILIILCIYTVTLLSWIPLYSSASIQWEFYPSINRTLLGAVITQSEDEVHNGIDITNACFGMVAVAAIAVFTTILIFTLRRTAAWRRSANIQQKKAETMSNRDKATLVMVIMIAAILFVCYTPSVILCLVAFFEPEFNLRGRYVLIYEVCWSFALVFENLNSSINILVYLNMSSKYRYTFNTLFRKHTNFLNY